jgi:hypothetical protein
MVRMCNGSTVEQGYLEVGWGCRSIHSPVQWLFPNYNINCGQP